MRMSRRGSETKHLGWDEEKQSQANHGNKRATMGVERASEEREREAAGVAGVGKWIKKGSEWV
jgi:hypothetical protein